MPEIDAGKMERTISQNRKEIKHLPRISKYAWYLAAVWTLIIGGSMLWAYVQEINAARTAATEAARQHLIHDLSYREWNNIHSCIYTPIADSAQPGPYLENNYERDIAPPSDRFLTLRIPDIMTKQVYELGSQKAAIRSHITSLDPIRPENEPDAWEKIALEAFRAGDNEYLSISNLDGQPFARIMKPLKTEKKCLSCHHDQGYREGEIRGGIGVSVPLAPYRAIAQQNQRVIVFLHIILWSLGIAAVFLGARRFQHRMEEYNKTHKALKNTEERFKNLTEMLPEAVFETDENIYLTYANQKAFDLFGYSPDDLKKGLRGLDMIAPEDRDRARANIEKRMRGEEPGTIEYTAIRKDGSTFPVLFHAGTILKDGKPAGMRGIIVDITERKQNEKVLLESQLRYRIVAENTHDWEFWMAPDGEFRWISPSCELVSGRSVSDFTDDPSLMKEIIHPDDRIIWDNHKHETRHPASSEQIEFRIIHPDGSERWIQHKCRPVYDDQGHYIGTRGINRDITETKRLRELEYRAERLEMAGTIAGQVAHDFNNLLTPIIVYPDFIREGLPPDSPLKEYIDKIEYAANNMADINQDLLTMGRRAHYNRELIDINQVVQRAAREMETHSSAVAFRLHLSRDIMTVKGAAAQIHRALVNLIVNALDAMPDGGTITIKSENYYADDISIAFGRVPKGEYVRLTVSDTGHGIPEDIIQNILDPFFTTKATNKRRGSGLGLSVVHAVIKDHNGYLDLSTEQDKGTSFFLYFPIAREEIAENVKVSSTEGSESILIVDDDEIQREVSTKLLTSLGYNVSSVVSGEKAVEFVREKPQDLIIIDMIMPGGMDGTETYRDIVEINPGQKAIILSGYSETERVSEARELGVGTFLQKPVTKDMIGIAVRKELDRSEKTLAEVV